MCSSTECLKHQFPELENRRIWGCCGHGSWQYVSITFGRACPKRKVQLGGNSCYSVTSQRPIAPSYKHRPIANPSKFNSSTSPQTIDSSSFGQTIVTLTPLLKLLGSSFIIPELWSHHASTQQKIPRTEHRLHHPRPSARRPLYLLRTRHRHHNRHHYCHSKNHHSRDSSMDPRTHSTFPNHLLPKPNEPLWDLPFRVSSWLQRWCCMRVG